MQVDQEMLFEIILVSELLLDPTYSGAYCVLF
jgi:hypothetical protein